VSLLAGAAPPLNRRPSTDGGVVTSSAVSDISINLISSGLGAGILYGTQRTMRWAREKSTTRAFRNVFGPRPARIRIIHSSVFDDDENAYNYPATDTRAARHLAQFFESMRLREGADFVIEPDRRVHVGETLWNDNIVLLCGPARNELCLDLITRSTVRHKLLLSDAKKMNVLIDEKIPDAQYLASRELPPEMNSESFDYGLIASFPNPYNSLRRIVVLAGIHGTGTVGAVEFICHPENLEYINQRLTNGQVSKVVKVHYENGDVETPKGIERDFKVASTLLVPN
jgi:hypothetical protein